MHAHGPILTWHTALAMLVLIVIIWLGVRQGRVPGEDVTMDSKPGIYTCTECGSNVYYPDTHKRDCPYYMTRKGKPSN